MGMFSQQVFCVANGNDLERSGLKSCCACRSISGGRREISVFPGFGLVFGNTAHAYDLDQIIHCATGEARRILESWRLVGQKPSLTERPDRNGYAG